MLYFSYQNSAYQYIINGLNELTAKLGKNGEVRMTFFLFTPSPSFYGIVQETGSPLLIMAVWKAGVLDDSSLKSVHQKKREKCIVY